MVRRAVAVALSVMGLVLALPAAARAVPPVCPDADLRTLPGVALNLPTPTCTNVSLITGFTVTDPPHGTFTQGNPNVYTPDAGFHGPDQFSYTITDWFNGMSNPATVRVVVDTAPTCGATTATVASVLPALTCSDPDGDALTPRTANPAHGTLAFPPDGSIVYTPAPGYSGPDSFTYRAEDPFGLTSDEATMTLTVTPPPVATVMPTPTPAPKDTTAPALTLENASKKQAVAIVLTTSENASATLTLTLDKATAKQLKLSRTVGTRKSALTSGKASTVSITLSSKARKALKKLKRVKLTLTAVVTDAAGNATTKTLAVTLKK